MSDRTLRSDARTWLGLLLLVSAQAMGEPTPVADESLLLFLADMIEVEGELTDALDMLEIELSQDSESLHESTESVLVGESAEQ